MRRGYLKIIIRILVVMFLMTNVKVVSAKSRLGNFGWIEGYEYNTDVFDYGKKGFYNKVNTSFFSRIYGMSLYTMRNNEEYIKTSVKETNDVKIKDDTVYIEFQDMYQNPITSEIDTILKDEKLAVIFEVSYDGERFEDVTNCLELEEGKYKFKADEKILGYMVRIINNEYHENPEKDVNITIITSHKVEILEDNISEEQKRSEKELKPFYSTTNTGLNHLIEENTNKMHIINPSISGTIKYQKLDNEDEIPSWDKANQIKDVEVKLIEDGGVVSETKTDESGKFRFSNIDGEKFMLKDSKNELKLLIDDSVYDVWSFEQEEAVKMNEDKSKIGNIVDISRQDENFNELFKRINWKDYFKELNINGKRAQDFKVILTEKTNEKQNGKVIANYLDLDGNVIIEKEVLYGEVGSEYETIQKDINGYKFLRIEGDKETGQFIDGELVVNYIYEKTNEKQNGKVIVNYLDVNGNVVGEREVLYGEVGSNYKTIQKDISGYNFSRIEGDKETGQFIDGELVVNYIYNKKRNPSNPKDPKDPEKPKEPEIPVKPKEPKGRIIGETLIPKVEYELNKKDHFAYIKGYKDNRVRPTGYITREEVAMVFYRLMEKEFREEIETSNHEFVDITKDTWSTKAIATLTNGEILLGYPDGTFRPHNNMTRGEISKGIARFTDVKVLETEFPDIIGHWAEDYINTVGDRGWIKGYEDGNFKPNELLTRGEFVTMMNSLLDRKIRKENALPGLKQFSDLPEKWYYEQMIESINGHDYEIERLDDGSEIWIRLVDTDFPD